MANENNENLDSLNEDNLDIDIENLDEAAAKEKLSELLPKYKETSENNKQLFARAKKAEGFELKDGKWVKSEKEGTPQEKPQKVENESPKEPSQSNELTDGQIAILRTEGIKTKDEIALVQEIMSETGKKNVLDVLDSGYFQSRLGEFRETKESANAVPKGKGRSGQTGSTDVDLAIAKYKEDGSLPSDFATRSKVIQALEKEEESSGMFDGPSVVGPRS